MKKKISLVLAALLAVYSVGALAQNGPDRRDDRQQENHRPAPQQRSGNGPDHRPAPPPQAHQAPQHGPQFSRGQHLPQDYRGRQYVVDDWRGHGLRQPPRGQQWVQVGGQYMLVAIATGVIASILINTH